MNEWVKVLLPIGATVVIAIISYFLRQSFARIDRMRAAAAGHCQARGVR